MKNLAGLLASSEELKQIYNPIILRLNNPLDKKSFDDLIEKGEVIFVQDEIYGQLQELVKSENPSIKIKQQEYPELISIHLAGRDLHTYGVWVYYPWAKRLVHLLDEDEFVEVRTNRNRYKITRDEQALLKTKKIGIVGLSVGQSIALTMAMERICGELRLADFDTAELSNLNRIRTGTQNLGLNKTVIAAREILEIDPFLNVKIFSDGITKQNIDEFFTADGKLDLFVEVCDGMDIKIQSRFKARELQIPVVMDTNDRGMMDVERFDLQPDRPILHGLADGLDPDNIKDLSNEDKIPYILKMIGADTISTRLKASMLEVEQSINTWPQLASSVTLGGALTTDVSRRILLDQYHDSGRYYIDLEELIGDKEPEKAQAVTTAGNPYLPLDKAGIKKVTDLYFKNAGGAGSAVTDDQLNKIIDAAIIAPSAGNNQPWKWVFTNGILFLFHDKYRSWSWGDYYEMGSHMALGAALENVHLQARALNLEDVIELFPVNNEPGLIAAIRFNNSASTATIAELQLADHIYTRYTNRKLGKKQNLENSFYAELKAICETGGIKILYVEDESKLDELAEIIAECDKVRLLNQLGHEEFYHEIRWSKEEAEKTKDGIELKAVDITQGEMAGFKVAEDWKAIKLLADWNQGNAFKKLSLKAVKCASAMILFTVPEFDHLQLINAGRAVQKAWIFANQQGISVHPMLSPTFFFNRLIHGKGQDITEPVANNLYDLRERFLKIFPLDKEDLKEVFLMKVAVADDIGIRSLRKDKNEIFYKA
jgi:hypothetical protein